MSSWFLRKTKANVEEVAKRLQVSDAFAAILLHRGIKNETEAYNFIHPELSNMHDPKDMHDMQKAVEKIAQDISNEKKITIYGDYDVDGVMSTVILYRTLKSLGANVNYYIPHRQKEGYGLNLDSVQSIAESGTNTILTCDNGIAAIEEVHSANNLNMAVVVLDHHEEGEQLPDAYAVVDPKKADCKYPFKLLCAGAISFKFSKLLCEFMKSDFDFEQNLVFAGIATVCDIVDLIDENRIITSHALRLFKDVKNPGLNALMTLLNIDASKITTFHIGFMIGPCINAAGRLEEARDSVDLFLSDDVDKAKELAGKLYDLNIARKSYTINAVENIVNYIEDSGRKSDKVYVIYNENVHESIAGIVAGRVKELYHHPTIVLTKSEGFAKGSARSIAGYNIFKELSDCKHLFLKFGGHPMAAGLSMNFENIEELRSVLNENCILTETDFVPKISIDCVLSPDKVDFALHNELTRLEPYGKANEKPIFGIINVNVRKIDIIGSNKNTLKFHFMVNRKMVCAIAFNAFKDFESKAYCNFSEDEAKKMLLGGNLDLQMDFCYTVGVNSYGGQENIQIVVEDFRFSNVLRLK